MTIDEATGYVKERLSELVDRLTYQSGKPRLDTIDRIHAFELAIKALEFQKEHENPWVKCSERLPEDDSPVLVEAIDKATGIHRTLKACYVAPHTQTTEDYEWRDYEENTEYDDEMDCFYIPMCWYEDNAVEDNGNWILDDDYDITQWMPLPEPWKEVDSHD